MSLSQRVIAADGAFGLVKDFYFSSRYGQARLRTGISDFTFGNPHELPLPGLVSAIQNRAEPHDKNWFAYKTTEQEPQAFVAEQASKELGLAFEPSDIALTTGAFAAILVAFSMLLDVGDEAVISEPAWFCYEPMLLALGAKARKVSLRAPTFDLDVSAIEAAIGPRTRVVVVCTPNNPTGRIYSRESLAELAEMLERASERIGHRIYLLSDEPYRRLRFDDRPFTSPASVYPWTLIAYSWGKILLAPGQRLGYLGISPMMPAEDRKSLQDIAFGAQMAMGWCFPNAVMQYALPDLEKLSIDRAALHRRRDQMVGALTGAGYEVLPPEGTFYLWAKWPRADWKKTWEALADRDVYVMPGTVLGAPEWFRISLTAADWMVERALPAFGDAVR